MAVWICMSPLLSTAQIGSRPDHEAAAKLAIQKVLEQWPRDFAARNAPAVCGLFAPDLLATYPGSADRSYSAMCMQLTRTLHDPQKTFRYDAPHIEEIVVSGPIAVVRLTWTLHVSSDSGHALETVRERGMDLFSQQKDGSWKIRISYAFPESDNHK